MIYRFAIVFSTLAFCLLSFSSCAQIQGGAGQLFEKAGSAINPPKMVEASTFFDRAPKMKAVFGSERLEHEAPVKFLGLISGGAGRSAAYLLSIDETGLALLWDVEKQAVTGIEFGDFRAASLSSAGRYLALVKNEGVFVFDFEAMAYLDLSTSISSRINSVAFLSKPKQSLLLAASDGRVYRWDGNKKRELERYSAHASAVSVVSSQPLGRVFFSGDWDGTLLAWIPYEEDRFGGEFDDNALLGRFFSEEANFVVGGRGDGSSVEVIDVDRAGERVLVAFSDGRVELWTVRGFEKELKVDAHKGLVMDATISSSGKRFASVGRDGIVRVWELAAEYDELQERESLRELLVEEIESTDAQRLKFLDDGRLAVADASGRVGIVSLQSASVESSNE